MSRKLAAASASAALLVSLASAPAAAVEAVSGTQLVMHIGPGAEHRAFATVPAETQLTVHGCIEAQGWCLVRFDGRRGWVEGESLNVVGFSRPPARPVAAPAAPQLVTVPVPVVTEVVLARRLLTADDVIVAMGETAGYAARVPRPASKRVDLKRRHRAPHAFERHGVKHDVALRAHGRFGKPHPDRRARHAGKDPRFGLPHLGKAGAAHDKGRHVGRAHFAKHGHVAHAGKPGGHRLRNGAAEPRHRFVKGGKAVGHAGKVRVLGLRLKGGWRP